MFINKTPNHKAIKDKSEFKLERGHLVRRARGFARRAWRRQHTSLVRTAFSPNLERADSSSALPAKDHLFFNALKLSLFVLLCGFLPVLGQTESLKAAPETPPFTYQGKLSDGGAPASGEFDLRFRLFDQESEPMSDFIVREDVSVTNGIFTLQLDFAQTAFTNAQARSLEIGVRRGAETGAFTTLAPRQPFASAPYAIQSLAADTAINTQNVGGTPAAQIIKEGDTRLSDARTPAPGSGNYIQNQSSAPQATTNFNIGGTGTANILNATTQFNLNGNRVLAVAGDNTFVGTNAGASNTGNANTFVGQDAGQINTAGSENTYFGYGSGRSATGSENTFFGSITGANTTGFANSFFGKRAGILNSTGIRNSFFGDLAGLSNEGGSNNTIIGARANVGAANLSFATAIGAFAVVTTSNTVVLGRPADTVQVPGKLRSNGSIFIAQPSSLIITSPNGACWFITVNNSGALSTIPATCP